MMHGQFGKGLSCAPIDMCRSANGQRQAFAGIADARGDCVVGPAGYRKHPTSTQAKRLSQIIRLMGRYVFFNSNAQDTRVLTAAKRTARSHGATVVKALAGTMLLELAPGQIPGLALLSRTQDNTTALGGLAEADIGARDDAHDGAVAQYSVKWLRCLPRY